MEAGDKVISPLPVPLIEGLDARSGIPEAAPIPWALERLKSFIRSIRLSLSRRLGGIASTGFTRDTSICGKTAVVALVVPIVADSCDLCCKRACRSHAREQADELSPPH